MPLAPLAGVRVLDFTAFPPGAMCTTMLADLGAEVVRVEPPSQKGRPSLIFGQVALTRGKRSITLDRRSPQAAAVLERLASAFDVVVENAKPGQMDAQGFGYARAREINPRIVWCAVTGYGQDGPYAERAGHDLTYVAHSGLLTAAGADLPWHPGVVLAGPAAGYAAVVGIQAALLQRVRTGEGGFVDISLSEACTWMLSGGIDPLTPEAMVLRPAPDRRLYACRDGRFVAVTSAEPRTWEPLCDALGLPELKPTLHDAGRAAEATEALAKAFAQGDAADWVERLGAAGASVAMVNHGHELAQDPQVRARQAVVEAGGVAVPASPVRVRSGGAETATATGAPPRVGDDTAEVLQSAGFTAAEIEALGAAAVV